MNKLEAIIHMLDTNPHLSISELAKRTGLSRTVFYKWRKGIFSNIHPDSVQKIADATDTKVSIDGDSINIIIEEEKMLLKADEIINNLNETIRLQREKISTLETQMRNPIYEPHSSAFDIVMAQVEDVTSRWNWVFQNSPVPMSIAVDGIIQSVNKALLKMLEYKNADSIRMKHILDFVYPDDRDHATRVLRKKDRKVELRIIKGNGNYCQVRINAKQFTDAMGNDYSVANIECVDPGCPDHKGE
jgi:PAS domain S-box-containing protein|tara:strand:- start:7053 stop:7787 length:735 start_codon:yes stop_codon:yes gene_type:complete